MAHDIPEEYLMKTSPLLMEGTSGRAWDRNLLLEFLHDESCQSFAVLGGDVLEVKNGQMQHTYDNWTIGDRKPGESFQSYGERSRTLTISYVSTYPDLPQYYFVPVWDNEMTVGL